MQDRGGTTSRHAGHRSKPCVIDSGTAKRTILFEKMVPHRQKSIDFVITPSLSCLRRRRDIYGKWKADKSVNSNLVIGGFYSIVVTLIYAETGFRWILFERKRIKLGNYWTDIEFTIYGATWPGPKLSNRTKSSMRVPKMNQKSCLSQN